MNQLLKILSRKSLRKFYKVLGNFRKSYENLGKPRNFSKKCLKFPMKIITKPRFPLKQRKIKKYTRQNKFYCQRF